MPLVMQRNRQVWLIASITGLFLVGLPVILVSRADTPMHDQPPIEELVAQADLPDPNAEGLVVPADPETFAVTMDIHLIAHFNDGQKVSGRVASWSLENPLWPGVFSDEISSLTRRAVALRNAERTVNDRLYEWPGRPWEEFIAELDRKGIRVSQAELDELPLRTEVTGRLLDAMVTAGATD